MNWFRTYTSVKMAVLATLCLVLYAAPSQVAAQSVEADLLTDQEGPYFYKGRYLYADIDTSRQRVIVLVESGLWSFDLEQRRWTLLDSLQNRPANMTEFEFAYNNLRDKMHLWSRGVGVVYDIDSGDYSLGRVDQSFRHRNQFNHYPFIGRNGMIYAFGGYGFWHWHNMLTFYNSQIREWNLQPVKPGSRLQVPLPVPTTAAIARSTSSAAHTPGAESSTISWR